MFATVDLAIKLQDEGVEESVIKKVLETVTRTTSRPAIEGTVQPSYLKEQYKHFTTLVNSVDLSNDRVGASPVARTKNGNYSMPSNIESVVKGDILKTIKIPMTTASHVASALVNEIGVEEYKDLSLVIESDLTEGGFLNRIQARKLLLSWKSTSQDTDRAIKREESSSGSEASLNQSPALCRSKPVLCSPNWAMDYEIPWHMFPADFIRSCNNDEVPSGISRRHMVKILVDEFIKIQVKFRKKDIDTIAFRISSKYPRSFSNTYNETDYGVQSLADQIMNRYEYVKRQNKKRNLCLLEPKHDNEDTTVPLEMQTQSKKWLIDHYKLQNHDLDMVKFHMKRSYPLQRELVKSKATVGKIKTEFPFLNDAEHFYDHFCTLFTNPEAVEQFKAKLSSSPIRIFKALKYQNSVGIFAAIKDIRKQCKEIGNSSPKSLRFIDLLACNFKEETCSIYQVFESNVEMRDNLSSLQAEPVIVAVGKDFVTAEEFFVVIDRCITMKFTEFISALVYAFCAFHVFNIKYPDSSTLTYDFIQRYYAGLNVSGFSRKKYRHTIHPKVLRLCQLLDAN